MSKIRMTTPLVEMDGDEMTRIIWRQIKTICLEPFVDLKTEYFDLGLKHRDETEDKVTLDAARRSRELGVAVKCATITPNAQRVEEYQLKKCGRANATIRAPCPRTARVPASIMVSCIGRRSALAKTVHDRPPRLGESTAPRTAGRRALPRRVVLTRRCSEKRQPSMTSGTPGPDGHATT